jgi:hypothetical protein
MAAAHLSLEIPRRIIGRELAVLLRQHELPCQVKEKVSHLFPDHDRVVYPQRGVQLEHFLDQVGAKGFSGLNPVPRTSVSQVAHDRQGTSKR